MRPHYSSGELLTTSNTSGPGPHWPEPRVCDLFLWLFDLFMRWASSQIRTMRRAEFIFAAFSRGRGLRLVCPSLGVMLLACVVAICTAVGAVDAVQLARGRILIDSSCCDGGMYMNCEISECDGRSEACCHPANGCSWGPSCSYYGCFF